MLTLEQAMAKASKLLKLSESSNAHEAALAASMAQQILARYNIDMAALAVDGEPQGPAEPVSRDHDILDGGAARLAQWKVSLADAVARANGCRAFQNRKRSMYGRTQSSIILVGRVSDVAKVRYIYGMLAGEVDKLAAVHTKGKGRAYATSFRVGVVSAVGDNLEAAHAKVAADMRAEHADNSAALVRVDRALERMAAAARELDAWIRANMRIRNVGASGGSDGNARAAGYAAGQSINVGGNARAALGAGQRRLGS